MILIVVYFAAACLERSDFCLHFAAKEKMFDGLMACGIICMYGSCFSDGEVGGPIGVDWHSWGYTVESVNHSRRSRLTVTSNVPPVCNGFD